MSKDELWALVQKAKVAREVARYAWLRFFTSLNTNPSLLQEAKKASRDSLDIRERTLKAISEEIE